MSERKKTNAVAKDTLKCSDIKRTLAADRLIDALEADFPQARALHARLADGSTQFEAIAKNVLLKLQDSRKYLRKKEKAVQLIAEKLNEVPKRYYG